MKKHSLSFTRRVASRSFPSIRLDALSKVVRTWILLVLLGSVVCGCDVKPPDTTQPPVVDQPDELYALHNARRQQLGLIKLSVSNELRLAAERHAGWMAQHQKLSHTGVAGSSFSKRARDAGYMLTAGGENIAYGQRTPQAVMASWLNSRGHRKNIENKRWRDIGWGVAKSESGRLYWCVVFGVRNQEVATHGK